MYNISGMSAAMNTVRFSECGTYLASGGDERVLYVWKTNFTAVPSIRENLRREEIFAQEKEMEVDPVQKTQSLEQVGASLTLEEQSNFLGNRVREKFNFLKKKTAAIEKLTMTLENLVSCINNISVGMSNLEKKLEHNESWTKNMMKVISIRESANSDNYDITKQPITQISSMLETYGITPTLGQTTSEIVNKNSLKESEILGPYGQSKEDHTKYSETLFNYSSTYNVSGKPDNQLDALGTSSSIRMTTENFGTVGNVGASSFKYTSVIEKCKNERLGDEERLKGVMEEVEIVEEGEEEEIGNTGFYEDEMMETIKKSSGAGTSKRDEVTLGLGMDTFKVDLESFKQENHGIQGVTGLANIGGSVEVTGEGVNVGSLGIGNLAVEGFVRSSYHEVVKEEERKSSERAEREEVDYRGFMKVGHEILDQANEGLEDDGEEEFDEERWSQVEKMVRQTREMIEPPVQTVEETNFGLTSTFGQGRFQDEE